MRSLLLFLRLYSASSTINAQGLPEEIMTTGVVKEEVGAEASGSSRARDKRRISLVYDSQDEQDETERQEP